MFSSHWVTPIQRCLFTFAFLSGRQQRTTTLHQHNTVHTAFNSNGQIGGRTPHEQMGRPDGAGAGADSEMAAKSAETMMTDFILETQRDLDVRIISPNVCEAAKIDEG